MAVTAQIPNNKQASGNSNEADVEAQINQIRNDISGLAQTIADIGMQKSASLTRDAKRKAADIADSSDAALASVQEQLTILERDFRTKVQRNPLAAIGIAAGIGFLVAMLSRR